MKVDNLIYLSIRSHTKSKQRYPRAIESVKAFACIKQYIEIRLHMDVLGWPVRWIVQWLKFLSGRLRGDFWFEVLGWSFDGVFVVWSAWIVGWVMCSLFEMIGLADRLGGKLVVWCVRLNVWVGFSLLEGLGWSFGWRFRCSNGMAGRLYGVLIVGNDCLVSWVFEVIDCSVRWYVLCLKGLARWRGCCLTCFAGRLFEIIGWSVGWHDHCMECLTDRLGGIFIVWIDWLVDYWLLFDVHG